MDFKVFDTRKIDEYSKRAKEQWGQTSEYKEFEEKTKNWTKDDEATVAGKETSGLYYGSFLYMFR